MQRKRVNEWKEWNILLRHIREHVFGPMVETGQRQEHLAIHNHKANRPTPITLEMFQSRMFLPWQAVILLTPCTRQPHMFSCYSLHKPVSIIVAEWIKNRTCQGTSSIIKLE